MVSGGETAHTACKQLAPLRRFARATTPEPVS